MPLHSFHADILLIVLRPHCCYSLCTGPGPARYLLPTMTGSESHDCRRRTWPAFSFGRRIGSCKFWCMDSTHYNHTHTTVQLHALFIQIFWYSSGIEVRVFCICSTINLSLSHPSICCSLPFTLYLPHAGFGKSDTPGPAYFIDSTMTRTGKDGTPHYSLYGRHKDLGKCIE